jgi:Sulfate permease and related transporters (MFS superfamily)
MMKGISVSARIDGIPLVQTIRSYSAASAKRDLVSALTVAVVAIPQSMAYAIIAGVDPAYGLYTAIVSTIIGSLFGSSDHLIAGPTNAIALLIASGMKGFIGRDDFYSMLFLMTFIVGALQILFGLLRLGKAIQYVSHSVIVGFTAGAGILIALGQLNQFLGISIPGSAQMSTLAKVQYVAVHISQTNPWALGLGAATVLVILVCKRISKSVPGSLLGIVACAAGVVALSLDSKGVKLTGAVPASLPPLRAVAFSLDSAKELFGGSLAVAVIGLVEAISISKSISASSGQRIDANREFVAQGLANAIGSFFQCFAGSGSFTRSAINYYSGAATRISGILSGVFVALTLLFLAPYAKYIPMSSLAGVIMVIAYNMVNKREMAKISKVGKSDSAVMWITFAATVLMPDLDWAIYMGIAISIGLYLKDTNKVPIKILIPAGEGGFKEREIQSATERTDILVIQAEGNLYFGSAGDLEAKLDALVGVASVFILRMKTVVTIDVTSLEALKVFVSRAKAAGAVVLLCGVSSGLNSMLLKSELAAEIGEQNIFLSEDEVFASSQRALERARALIAAR